MCNIVPMSAKRIVFSTPVPNDQGLIVPNDSIDFTRFKANPVLLCQHDWNAPPLGKMEDCKLEGGKWTGIPVFHRLTYESNMYADLWEAEQLVACSIGGIADWEEDNAGRTKFDKAGNRTAKKFDLYEISMVTLPSNHQAVKMGAKFYERSEIGQVNTSLVTLSSKYFKTLPSMETKTLTPEEQLQAAQAEVTRLTALLAAGKETGKSPTTAGAGADPSYDQLPDVLKEIVKNNATERLGFMTFIKDVFSFLSGKPAAPAAGKEPEKAESAPKPKDEPESKISDGTFDQPEPTGLSALGKAAFRYYRETLQAAGQAILKAAALKAKAEKAGATKEDKDAYSSAQRVAENAAGIALEAEEAYKSCMDTDEGGEEMKGKKKTENGAGAGKTTMAAGGKQTTQAEPEKQPITMKTPEQMAAEGHTFAPKPEIVAKVRAGRTTFSALMDPKNSEGAKLLGRIQSYDSQDKQLEDYAIVLDALINDPKFKALASKVRVIANISGDQYTGFRRSGDLNERPGLTLQHFAAQLQSGCVDVMGKDNQMHRVTTLGSRETVKLTSTDNALAAPALNTIEWLSLAIFQLFPSNDWKNDIPMFGAQMTSQNTGLIWPNITAAPAITFGAQPVNPADYTYTDDAVALTLIPSWLQPMLWTPLTMHQLRYDQMATGWAQAFALWGAAIDDKLIYTLASTVPAGSIVYTVGQKAPNGPGASFTLTGANDPNSFYYNPALNATLATPAYSDVIRIEQIYAKQNFNLEREKPRLVIDPTMESFIAQDPFTQSLLTRWIDANREDVLKLKHTALNQRSRVAVFDPASGQVKDPMGVIPATAVSAGVGFIPNQVGIGIGILDVFMIQDPAAYGYRMSADIREGIVPVRKNYNGTILYTYGNPPLA